MGQLISNIAVWGQSSGGAGIQAMACSRIDLKESSFPRRGHRGCEVGGALRRDGVKGGSILPVAIFSGGWG